MLFQDHQCHQSNEVNVNEKICDEGAFLACGTARDGGRRQRKQTPFVRVAVLIFFFFDLGIAMSGEGATAAAEAAAQTAAAAAALPATATVLRVKRRRGAAAPEEFCAFFFF